MSNSSAESSKTLAGVGSILLILSIIPGAGAVLVIIGAILLLMGIKGLANYYQDDAIYQNALMGVIFLIIAAIIVAVAVVGSFVFFFSLLGFIFGLGVFFIGLIIAFVFYLLSAMRLRRTFSELAQKSGEHNFETAGTLYWWGAVLTIIFVGVILIFIAWIFSTIAFFSMRLQPQQQYVAPPIVQASTPSVSQPSAPSATSPTQTTRYCPNCGAPVQPNTAFCPNCGKPLPQ